MSKKLNVKLIKSGSENDILTRWIANYNEGNEKALISPRDLEGYLNTRNAVYPTIGNLKLVVDHSEPNTYHISEDGGKTFTMTIKWTEVYELSETTINEVLNSNDLEDVL